MRGSEALLLGRLAERFGQSPAYLVGLRFSRENCDLATSYDFDQAIRLRLAFRDVEEHEQAQQEAEDKLRRSKRKKKEEEY